jgi:transglutaminase-like putative cysteine protease
MAMPILCVRHETTYHYKRPVAFGEHRMMLRPRDDYDQKIIEAELEITPSPRRLAWTRDSFGNHVAIAQFAGRARELHFISNIPSRPCAGRTFAPPI